MMPPNTFCLVRRTQRRFEAIYVFVVIRSSGVRLLQVDYFSVSFRVVREGSENLHCYICYTNVIHWPQLKHHIIRLRARPCEPAEPSVRHMTLHDITWPHMTLNHITLCFIASPDVTWHDISLHTWCHLIFYNGILLCQTASIQVSNESFRTRYASACWNVHISADVGWLSPKTYVVVHCPVRRIARTYYKCRAPNIDVTLSCSTWCHIIWLVITRCHMIWHHFQHFQRRNTTSHNIQLHELIQHHIAWHLITLHQGSFTLHKSTSRYTQLQDITQQNNSLRYFTLYWLTFH